MSTRTPSEMICAVCKREVVHVEYTLPNLNRFCVHDICGCTPLDTAATWLHLHQHFGAPDPLAALLVGPAIEPSQPTTSPAAETGAEHGSSAPVNPTTQRLNDPAPEPLEAPDAPDWYADAETPEECRRRLRGFVVGALAGLLMDALIVVAWRALR